MLRRTTALILFAAVSISIVAAQPPPPRGAHSTDVPYALPHAAQTRGTIFYVTTTEDEEDIEGCDPSAGAGLSLREAIEYCDTVDTNATIFIPAGVYQLYDDLDAYGYQSLVIVGADPYTTIIDNVYEVPGRIDVSILAIDLDLSYASINNLTIRTSSSIQFAQQTGAVVVYGGGAFDVRNVIFENNSGGYGGALAIDAFGGLAVTVTNATFNANKASYAGGAISAISEIASPSSLTIVDSVFTGNEAGAAGGALSVDQFEIVSIINSSFLNNSATGDAPGDVRDTPAGGGADISAASITIVGSQFSGNVAGSPGHSGIAGGVMLTGLSVNMAASQIEDNIGVGTDHNDCVTAVLTEIVSSGGNGIGSLAGCAISYHPADQFDNLISNGGFEQQGGKKKVAASWTMKPGATRACNKPNKAAVAQYGSCVLQLKGGTAKQNLDLNSIAFDSNAVLMLYAQGKGGAKSKVVVTAKVAYSDGSSAHKTKLTLNGAGPTPGYDALSMELPLLSDAVSKLTVTIKDKSAGGKAFIDRVYLFESAGYLRGGVLPPPAAPEGFRGGN